MNRIISNAFIDKSSTIYLVDNKGILYVHEKEICYPFPIIIPEIKNCFFLGKYYYIHHGTTIKVFNDDFYPCSDQTNLVITSNINKVCYSDNLQIIVTLEKGEIFINFVAKNNFKRMNLNKIYGTSGYVDYYNDMKIINNNLFCIEKSKVNIYHLERSTIRYVQTICLDNEIFQSIFDYDMENNILYLSNGNILSIGNDYKNSLVKQIFFQKRPYCFFVVNDGILCYLNEEADNILTKISNMLPVKSVETIIESEKKRLVKILLPEDFNVKIIDNNIEQMVLFDNSVILIKGGNLVNICIDVNRIFYNKVLAIDYEKYEIDLTIDIVDQKSIVEQLISIIPLIYRCNNEKNFLFEQIDSEHNVKSYGIGVCRQTFHLLRKEIDDILKNNFGPESNTNNNTDNVDYFRLGCLSYFCNREGHESFFCLHPYFFYKLAQDLTDYEILIKTFMASDTELIYEQFVQYQSNPSLLSELDMNIDTIEQYVEYIFSSNLEEISKKRWDLFYQGFLFCSNKHPFSSIINKLPINYHISNLMAEGIVKPELTYVVDQYCDSNKYSMFCKYFDEAVSNLTADQMIVFVQNITGSEYYSGKIRIILSNKQNLNITSVQNIYDENTLDEEPISIRNITLGIDMSTSDNDNGIEPEYTISTCFAELRINVEPTESNIKKIIELLIIEDLRIKN